MLFHPDNNNILHKILSSYSYFLKLTSNDDPFSISSPTFVKGTNPEIPNFLELLLLYFTISFICILLYRWCQYNGLKVDITTEHLEPNKSSGLSSFI